MKIYSTQGIELLDLIATDNSYRYKVIMGENTLNLYFNLPEFQEIPEGSYVDFKSERYFLLRAENFKQNHSRDYEYTLTLDSYQALTQSIKFKFFTLNAGVVDSPYEIKFSLTQSPRAFAQLICDNMNVAEGSTAWTVGDCIESEPVCIDFNNDYCYGVLAKIAEAFTTEWEFENKTLHIRKVEKLKDSPIPLRYGYNSGLIPGTTRSNAGDKKVITRLFVEGSDRNIDRSAYGASTLHMPKNHTINYMGVDYVTDATGTYIQRSPFVGRVAEESLDLTKIYPKRVGTVSTVTVVNAEKCLYDIIDADIPGTLDYSQLIIAGETMTIIFQTGQLAGKEFEVKYIHADKRFEIVPITDNGLNYPDGSLVPEIGDKYAVFHCMLPADYVESAEMDALNEAVKFLYENEFPKYSYTGTLDELYAKRNWLTIGGFLNCGYFVSLSADFLPEPVAIRITAVKEYINKPQQPEITLSNEVSGTSLSSKLNEIPAQEQTINRVNKQTERFARRQFAAAKQTAEMLQSALLNFSGSVNPLTVQTMQLIAGDESLQFRFVTGKTNPVRVDIVPAFNTGNKTLTMAAGILQHMTLGIVTLTAAHLPAEYKFWDMSAYVSPALTAEKPYYLYAKCAESGTAGTFTLSENAINMGPISGYYYFLVGILNSEADGDRSFAPLYGFSEILPGRITTDKIVSSDGNTFFDLVNGIIAGKIKFISTGGSLEEVGAAIDEVAQNVTYKVEIVSSNGTSFRNDMISTTLTAYVYRGKEDITASINQGAFRWIRKSNDTAADNVWNNIHASFGSNILNITSDDVEARAVFSCAVTIN